VNGAIECSYNFSFVQIYPLRNSPTQCQQPLPAV
jgi:hypothetical protein